MKTPIFDFVQKYADSGVSRMHMPGHKGAMALGCEKYDITEILGADVLYSADGIIDESERNLSALYGTEHSFYSTQGSTLAIFAMLRLVSERDGEERPLILAARNVHTAFIKAVALLDLDVEWIYPKVQEHLCSCNITPADLEGVLSKLDRKPTAVYITSPDYLGNMLDIAGISTICREKDIPLLVDNAHGAYLKFLEKDSHPITLGAAMCSDSAHKTLPVLTGGAYLHISKDYPEYASRAREALLLFASTSPSYLTLCSLDLCNDKLSNNYPEKIRALANTVFRVKQKITDLGFELSDSEPLKIVFKGGYVADHIRKHGIEPEFADNDYTVLMLTPENTEDELDKLLLALTELKDRPEPSEILSVAPHKRVMTIRSAVLSPSEQISVNDAAGRVCASSTVSCPPAVPIVVSGELIDENDVYLFRHYGVEKIRVVKEI